MGLLQQLQTDLKTALRAKEEPRLTTIRSLLAAVKNEEIAKRDAVLKRFARERGVNIEDIRPNELPPDAALNDADIRQVISREIKKRQETVDIYRNAGRNEAAAAEEAEIAVLRSYLPKQLSAEELRPQLQTIIQEVGATSKADMKKVMPVVMSRFKDRADGRTLNQLVQELLG